jgi:hypothetical protein
MKLASLLFSVCTSGAFAADVAITDETLDTIEHGRWIELPWFDGGLVSVGTNWACLSDPPIYQIRTQGYAGFAMRPPDLSPAVGEVFYTHLVVSHPGNPCGGSAVGIELLLPPGVTPATSEENPAYCFAVTPANSNRPYEQLFNLALDPAYGCPQTFPQGLEGLRVSAPNGGIGGGAWGMAQGVWLELLIPVRSDRFYWGDANIRYRINPDIAVVGYAEVPVFVNNDTIFRHSLEGDMLFLDICGGNPPPNGC